MDCKTFALLLDVSPEERGAEQNQQMQLHAAQCRECAMLLALSEDCRAMDAGEELPPEYTLGWRMLIRKEEAMEKKQAKKQLNWQRMLATAAAVVLVFGGATMSYLNGWGLPTENENNSGNLKTYARGAYGGVQANYMLTSDETSSYDMAAAQNESAMMVKSTADTGMAQETKIIRTINYTIKTNQYDADFEAIKALVDQHGGYVESLSISGDTASGETRYAHFTLRVPSGQLEAFLGGADNVGVATSYSEYTEDVSNTYYDIAARLDTQLAKMERLNELLAQAVNMSDLIEIESAISDTQYQIDRYTGQLNGYDSRINYSYVYVTLRELSPADITELPDVTLSERIANAVKASVAELGEFAQAAAVFLIAALPWCAVLVVLIIAVKIARKVIKKK